MAGITGLYLGWFCGNEAAISALHLLVIVAFLANLSPVDEWKWIISFTASGLATDRTGFCDRFSTQKVGEGSEGLIQVSYPGLWRRVLVHTLAPANGRFSGRSVSEDGGGALAGVSLLGPWNRVDHLAIGP